jgi:hypothetical protein
VVKPAGPNQRYWREGDLLVVMHNTQLPRNVCLVTGERDVVHQERGKIHWAPPWTWALIPFGFIAPLIMSLAGIRMPVVLLWIAVGLGYTKSRRSILMQHAFGRTARRRRWLGYALNGLGPLLGLYFVVVGVMSRDEWYPALGFAVTIAALVVGSLLGLGFRVVRIENETAWLKVRPQVFESLGLSFPPHP